MKLQVGFVSVFEIELGTAGNIPATASAVRWSVIIELEVGFDAHEANLKKFTNGSLAKKE